MPGLPLEHPNPGIRCLWNACAVICWLALIHLTGSYWVAAGSIATAAMAVVTGLAVKAANAESCATRDLVTETRTDRELGNLLSCAVAVGLPGPLDPQALSVHRTLTVRRPRSSRPALRTQTGLRGHRRARQADPPGRRLGAVRQSGEVCAVPSDPVARLPTHGGFTDARFGRPGKGRLRDARSLVADDHAFALCAHVARNGRGSRCRSLSVTARLIRGSGFEFSVVDPPS